GAKLSKEKRGGATLPTALRKMRSYCLSTRPQSFNSAKLKRGKIVMCNALILSVAKRKLGKFFRMQYSGQSFDAVDNPRAWARKVSARVDQINLAGARSRK